MLKYSRIKDILKEKKMSQTKIADLIGMTREGYGRMIRDKTLKVSTLEKISGYLEVPITDFFTELNPNQETIKNHKTSSEINWANENNPNTSKNMNRLINAQITTIESQAKTISMLERDNKTLQMKLDAFELGNELSKDAC
jgi:transcriptional regulator with XRE-family HTH domain